MPGLYKVEGVVLRKRPIGEADDVVTLLTPTHGRLDAVARGVRKPTASLVGRLEPFTQVRLLLARGRSLDTISQAQVVRTRRFLEEDLYQIACGLYLLELFYRLVEPQQDAADAKVFTALLRSLDELESSCDVHYDLICRRAELRLLLILGSAPQLDVCVVCSDSRGLDYFTMEGGGAICVDCRSQVDKALAVDRSALELLRQLRLPQLAAVHAATCGFARSACLAAEHLLASYLEWHCPAHVKSRRFLKQVASSP